jgi:hypothetical protein
MPAAVINLKNKLPHPHFESGTLSPRLSNSKVREKLEKAYAENDIANLIEFLAYAKVFHLFIKEGRKFFKKIEEGWAKYQKEYPHLGNKFSYLNGIYNSNYISRNDSAQIANRSAIIAEFSNKY